MNAWRIINIFKYSFQFIVFSIAEYYSEKANTEYWTKENEKIQNEYLKDTYEDRVDAAYYNNAVAIALAAKYISDKDVNEKQIPNL